MRYQRAKMIEERQRMQQKTKSEYIQIKVTPDLKARVQKYCDDTGRTMTAWITVLMEKELEKASK
jgi:predicted DNA-binding protein